MPQKLFAISPTHIPDDELCRYMEATGKGKTRWTTRGEDACAFFDFESAEHMRRLLVRQSVIDADTEIQVLEKLP